MFELHTSDVTAGLALAVCSRSECTARLVGSAVQPLVEDICRRLAWEVDLVMAVAVTMIQLCDKGAALVDKSTPVEPDFVVDVAVLAAAKLAMVHGYRLDVQKAREGLPAAHARPDRQVVLPGLVESWLHRGGGQQEVARPQPGPTPDSPIATHPRWEPTARRARGAGSGALAVVGSSQRPRAFVATPLTRIDQDTHDLLLAIARAVQRCLDVRGYHTIVPGLTLAPNVSDDSDLDERYERERLLITGADLVVVVGAETDSWGLSKTVTWAEMGGAPVIVLGRETQPWCRVLGGGPYRLRQYLVDNPDDLNYAMDDAMSELAYFVALRAADRLAVTAAMQEPLRAASRRLRQVREGPMAGLDLTLTPARAESILSNATAFATASVEEVRALEAFLGAETVSGLLHAATGFGNHSGVDATDLTRRRTLGSAQFQALLSGRTLHHWTDRQLLELISDFFAADGRMGRAAQTRSGSLSDWVARARRLFRGR